MLLGYQALAFLSNWAVNLIKNDFLESVLWKENTLMVWMTLCLKASQQRVSDAQWASYIFTQCIFISNTHGNLTLLCIGITSVNLHGSFSGSSAHCVIWKGYCWTFLHMGLFPPVFRLMINQYVFFLTAIVLKLLLTILNMSLQPLKAT